MKRTVIEVAVIKAWIDDFVPSDQLEEEFKSKVKDALTQITVDFIAITDVFSEETCETDVNEHVRFMRIPEYWLLWAYTFAKGEVNRESIGHVTGCLAGMDGVQGFVIEVY